MTWHALFNDEAVEDIIASLGLVENDWQGALAGWLSHRFQCTAGKSAGERCFGWDDYSHLGKKVVEAGLTLRIDDDGKPSVMHDAEEPLDQDW